MKKLCEVVAEQWKTDAAANIISKGRRTRRARAANIWMVALEVELADAKPPLA